jgi:hypothetical protein
MGVVELRFVRLSRCFAHDCVQVVISYCRFFKGLFVLDPPAPDWQNILQAQYALGGHFASQANYIEFLSSLDEQKKSENMTVAIAEKIGEFLRLSKSEMMAHINSKPKSDTGENKQLSLL